MASAGKIVSVCECARVSECSPRPENADEVFRRYGVWCLRRREYRLAWSPSWSINDKLSRPFLCVWLLLKIRAYSKPNSKSVCQQRAVDKELSTESCRTKFYENRVTSTHAKMNMPLFQVSVNKQTVVLRMNSFFCDVNSIHAAFSRYVSLFASLVASCFSSHKCISFIWADLMNASVYNVSADQAVQPCFASENCFDIFVDSIRARVLYSDVLFHYIQTCSNYNLVECLLDFVSEITSNADSENNDNKRNIPSGPSRSR